MLDIKLIRDNAEEVIAGLNKRCGDYESRIKELIACDDLWRKSNHDFERLRSEQKKLSKVKEKPSEDKKEEMRQMAEAVKALGSSADELKKRVDGILLELPNLPDKDVVAGGKEHNEVIRTHGSYDKPEHSVIPHYDICNRLSLIDYERGVKLAGNGNWLYRGNGAMLEWALINYFIDIHNSNGYDFVLPPHILTYTSGVGAGQFPKFQDDVFLIDKAQTAGERKFLLPTSETALINIYRDEIIDERALPLKLFSYTPCYRREAGSYRSEERGTIRGHQFNKVEMFHFAHPETSADSFDELVERAASLVEGLGLHFRISKLAAGDVSASMRRTYDIEVLIPSMGYKEVSSVSNAGCYQSRRANIRFKDNKSGTNAYLHTLNGSGLATSRLIPAIVEQFQTKEGHVLVPGVLQKWVGSEVI